MTTCRGHVASRPPPMCRLAARWKPNPLDFSVRSRQGLQWDSSNALQAQVLLTIHITHCQFGVWWAWLFPAFLPSVGFFRSSGSDIQVPGGARYHTCTAKTPRHRYLFLGPYEDVPPVNCGVRSSGLRGFKLDISKGIRVLSLNLNHFI